MPVRQPVFIKRLAIPGTEAFATLYGLESMARAILATAIPLEALRLFGDAQGVSQVFLAVSVISLVGGLSVPWLIGRTARRFVYTFAFLTLVVAAPLLASHDPEHFLLGMACRAVAVAATTICLSLYIMDFIGRRDFSQFEPTRLFYSAGAWSFGPFLGVFLASTVHPFAPYALSMAFATSALGYFWFLRIREDPAVRSSRNPAPSPLRYVRRFFAQPRLSLSWILATGRNIWWVVFFIYAPIYAVESGLGEIAGGAIVSLGTSFLFLMPLLGRSVRSWGVRGVLVAGFAFAGGLTLSLLFVWSYPWLAAMVLVSAAFGMISVDATGNVLFMLAVKKRERAEMTAVYSTFRDVADISPPAILSVLLRFYELPVVFLFSGGLMLFLSALSLRIHPRIGRGRAPVTSRAPSLSPDAAA